MRNMLERVILLQPSFRSDNMFVFALIDPAFLSRGSALRRLLACRVPYYPFSGPMKSLYFLILFSIVCAAPVSAQKKSPPKKKAATTSPPNELSRLRDQYISTTKEYKASLQKLLTLYEDSL